MTPRQMLAAITTSFQRPASTAVIGLVLLATVTRFYQLGSIPHGLTWDEAAIGYNGYSIVTTRRDEWLEKLPVSFRSFGDYKAPLAIYINGLFTYLLGLNAFAVRAPFALAGVVFIVAFGLLVRQLFNEAGNRTLLMVMALVFALTSPWHFHYSRIGFESGIALSLITISLACLVAIENALKKHVFSAKLIGLLVAAAVSLVASLYAYHSAKITVPLLLLYVGFRAWGSFVKFKVIYSAVVLLAVLLTVPLINDSLYGSGAKRADVLITAQGYPVAEVFLEVGKNFISHFDPSFLVFGETNSLRHGIGSLGVLSVTSLILALIGLLWLRRSIRTESLAERKSVLLALVIIVTGILPASLSSESVPHSNRALLSLPGFLLLSVLGAKYLMSHVDRINKELVVRIVLGMVIMLEGLFFISLWKHYNTTFAQASSADFQDGYVEALILAEEYERGKNGKPQADQILVSSEYGQPYIYALFVRKTSPIYYQGGSLVKYIFTDSISSSDLSREKTLIVATPSSGLPADQADHLVKGSDGQVRFMLYYTGEQR